MLEGGAAPSDARNPGPEPEADRDDHRGVDREGKHSAFFRLSLEQSKQLAFFKTEFAAND